VHHASKAVLGLANTKENAACHAPPHAAVSLATSGAAQRLSVAINALAYAAKRVRKNIAKFVPRGKTLEWIFSK
jgi:hypothetical protein